MATKENLTPTQRKQHKEANQAGKPRDEQGKPKKKESSHESGHLQQIRHYDLEHFWHPYTNIDEIESGDFPIFTKAKGPFIWDSKGKKYIDGISSWWSTNLGHGNPRLIKAITKQAKTLQNAMTGNASNEPVATLSRELSQITPRGLSRCFFCSDGSSAVECALRIARQYWSNIAQNPDKDHDQKAKKVKKYFVSLEGSYHGDTMGCVSVGYNNLFHAGLEDTTQMSISAQAPDCANCPFGKSISTCQAQCFANMEDIISSRHEEIIGVIVEPLFQGAAGMKIYSEKYLQKLAKACRKYGVLLIVDEIATGFYRTGKMFACQTAQIEPDIIILGKGLTGGYLPMSAVVTSQEIYDSFRGGRTLYYGHTFSGNPILAKLAIEAIKEYKRIKPEKIAQNCNRLAKLAQELNDIPIITTQHCGMVIKASIETFKKESGKEATGPTSVAKEIARACMERGLFIRNLGNTVYLFPPINIDSKTLELSCQIFKLSLDEVINRQKV